MPPNTRHLPSHVIAITANPRGAIVATNDGGVERVSHRDAARHIRHDTPPLTCHSRDLARRLNIAPFPTLDLLELFAFVRPAQFCVPTPNGLAAALNIVPPAPDQQAAFLFGAAEQLLRELTDANPQAPDTLPIAWAMARANWPWGGLILRALGAAGQTPHSGNVAQGLKVWTRLKEWSEHAPEPSPGHEPVHPDDAKARLREVLGDASETRAGQIDYTARVTAAFAPRDLAGDPPIVLAEAGTGVGKTLGYIAPASLWAELNHNPVWLSTFTKNLQRQIDGELERLYSKPGEKRRKVVIRKGRENYLCLLNLEEAVARLKNRPEDGIALGIVARWVLASRDGDMSGGDFPAWLGDLLGRGAVQELTDTRGECIYSACSHYGKCFVEKSIRRARRADLVITNHALVMIQAALGGGDEAFPPTRLVFDEGHHIFNAADSAFSARISGQEASDLRRWIRGNEDTRRSRARGLRDRIGELLNDQDAFDVLDQVLHAAAALPGPGWHQRIAGGLPTGPAEMFLAGVREQVYARDPSQQSPYSLEAPVSPLVPGLLGSALQLRDALSRLLDPMRQLVARLAKQLDDDSDTLDTPSRLKIEAAIRSVERRGVLQVSAWRAMLDALESETPPEFADWFEVERFDGRDYDVAMNRHWIDPSKPFAESVLEPAHGVLITSATLCDRTEDADPDWASADNRVGPSHMPSPALHLAVDSPFDYPNKTRVYVIGDVRKNDMAQVAAAYRELFLASGGGGLGLFTAISRLREVYGRIAGPMDHAGLTLRAQHVDALDTGTLVDVFRAEEDSCLLGTDAVRDGVDVPGRSLRLIAFDRVPWPRPTILHKKRKEAFGGRRYDEMLTRLKIKQAYGRLLRQDSDQGVFVILDRAFPTRLGNAFPPGVELRRVGLAEAIADIQQFLAPKIAREH